MLQVYPRLLADAPTGDEPFELSNGFQYWAGDTRTHDRHPPLAVALQALPARFMANPPAADPGRDALERAYHFLFVANGEKAGRVLLSARLVTLLFYLGLGCLLFLWLRKDRPDAAPWALALWAFEPTGLAFAGYVMADVPLSFFFLASVMAFQWARKKHGETGAAWAGMVAGMAITAKFSGMVLIPLLLLLDGWDARFRPSGRLARRWAAWTVGCLAWIGLVYSPGWLMRNGGMPWDSYRDFLDGLADMARYGREAHHPSFFLGEAGRNNHWLFFPVAFLLKTPLPFLILLAGGAWAALRGRWGLSRWVWVPGVLFAASILGVQNLGVRYLLPAYPFFMVVAGLAAAEWMGKGRAWRLCAWGLGAWAAATSLAAFPYHLSYFNDLVPAGSKIALLGDSNLDIGQDLGRLAHRAADAKWPPVHLAMAGVEDPGFYGMDWEWWTEKDLAGPQPGKVYAVNASFLQLSPVFEPALTPIAKSWITRIPPTEKVGDTWFVWVVPGDAVKDDSRLLASVPCVLRYRNVRPPYWPGGPIR